ncbi:alpha/beta fold hydrolase [Allonocardiopsis opalescens]|uniref:Pimeloyl-ACP methyl ester carboxylesterase n=1 Tax=Allonocardiopsis opalescens TaxID=1144618 RepID=A0A2T0QFV1_9ACTN|nr:alpha/beta fold hydrolase [Allonocardiopsis opalescens]PRY02721.1 pimeloyl-ACP methyl ester carboxylesterase [Allonocardiopsis opalescens]
MTWQLPERFDSPHGAVRWTSRGRGRPLVFLHGTPFSSYVWREVAAALAESHTVYLWDMPGYGRSEMADGQDVSLPAQQRVFTALLDHWGLREPDVAAHDFGGAVALRAAVLDKVRYRRLALLNPVALRPWGSDFFRLVREHAGVFGALPAALHEALVRGYLASATHGSMRPEVADALVAPWLGPAGQAAFGRQIAQADERFTAEVEDGYGRIDVPALVLWGREDRWLPASHAGRLAERLPRARVRLLDGAGHLVQEDAPARLTAALSTFLDAED